MRVAVLMQLAPRKLGSFERWLLALAREARRRGHTLDLFGLAPMHPVFVREAAAAGAGLFPLAELEGNPVQAVRRLASYDVLHLNLLAPRGRVAMLASAAWPAKVVFVDHSSGVLGARSWMSRLADQVTMARVSRVVGVSRFVSDRARRRFGLTGNRVCTVYNGVAVPPPPPPRPAGPLRILAAAYLIPEKGVHDVLGAVARLPASDFKLQIVGDGPQEEALRARTAALGIGDRVEFLGLRDDVPELMARAHVFAHPARWAEAFGLTVAEAMAAGCAVVASRIGALPELIEHGRTGLLVEPGDEAQLADALAKLVADRDLCRDLGTAARYEAHARFAVETCVHQHLAVCEGVLETAAARRGRGRTGPLLQPGA